MVNDKIVNVSATSDVDQDKLLFRYVHKDLPGFPRVELEGKVVSFFICGFDGCSFDFVLDNLSFAEWICGYSMGWRTSILPLILANF